MSKTTIHQGYDKNKQIVYKGIPFTFDHVSLYHSRMPGGKERYYFDFREVPLALYEYSGDMIIAAVETKSPDNYRAFDFFKCGNYLFRTILISGIAMNLRSLEPILDILLSWENTNGMKSYNPRYVNVDNVLANPRFQENGKWLPGYGPRAFATKSTWDMPKCVGRSIDDIIRFIREDKDIGAE